MTNLEPYLAAPMHLAIVSAGLDSFIHTHGEIPDSGEKHHDHTVMMNMKPPPPAFGPEINAEVVFPKKGLYKVFSEVKHDGQVILIEFMVEVL